MGAEVSFTAYGREALEALRALMAEAKRDNPMAPVTVLVPNNIAGIVARRYLAQGLTDDGNGVAGIWFTTLPRLAEQLAAPTLTAQGRRPATRAVTATAVRSCLSANSGKFAAVAEHPATARALAGAHQELRDADDTALRAVADAGALAGEVVRLHRETTERLAGRWYDTTDLLTTATRLVTDGTVRTDELGAVVLYLPQDPTRAETAFVRALADRTGLQIIAGVTGAPRADRAPLAVTAALGLRDAPPAPHEPGATRVLTASDSDDEVRCVVREVVRTLGTTPAHRVAVLYAARSPYARLLHEHLGAAGIAVNGPGVRPVAERALSRLVLGLLETARTGYRRSDVLRALGEVSTTSFAGERISVPAWERVSREAGVVEGDDWDLRLAVLIDGLRGVEADDDAYNSAKARARRTRESAEALRDFVMEVQSRMAEADRDARWSDLARWATDLLDDLVPPSARERMPVEEQYAAVVLERALTGLAALDDPEGGQPAPPGVAALEEVLSLELDSALPRVGRFGEGVLVAPVTHAIGLDLDVAFVVGLSEDLYPGRLHEDSLLPERVRERSLGQLPSIRERHDVKERGLLAAFQCAADVTVSFPRGDLRRHTHRLPSRWLLPTLRHLCADPDLAATDFEKATSEWVEESPSFAGSLLTTDLPATGQEWRVRAIAAGGAPSDQVVDAARAMAEGRESAAFTRFDGNLAGVEGLPDLTRGEPSVSPTALERYAICPHEYFVRHLLRVSPVEEPEEAVEVSVLDVGTIIHESFDILIRQARDDGRLPDYGQPWADDQRDRLQEIGASTADRFEAEGRTGHPLLWARQRDFILATLDWMVTADNAWRAEQDARVVASELAFGVKDAPAVVVPVEKGTVAFRGSADKVDQRRDGTLLVTDIKSGSARKFTGLSEDDPVAHGEKLQLPVYAHAAREAHGTRDTPVEAHYWFVGRKHRGQRIEVPLTAAVEQTYAATVDLLASGIARGAFPQRAPEKPDWRQDWVQCAFCNPDGLGHVAARRHWEAKRFAPELKDYTALLEPDAVPAADTEEEQG